MSFPKVDRVIYRRNPLVEVVCQFRFPTLLRIEKEIPSDFQQRLGDFFSGYEEFEKEEHLFSLKEGAGTPDLKTTRGKVFIFKPTDETWKVTLESSSVSLLTTKYTRWEEFRDKAHTVFSSFQSIYQLKQFTRIGLRYINMIQLKKLGLENEPWENLINQPVIGCLNSAHLPKAVVKEYLGQFTIELEDSLGYMNANYGLVHNTETREAAFGLDGDFFTSPKEKMTGELDHAFAKLDAYKDQANRYFRWCISDKLHKALEPEPLQ